MVLQKTDKLIPIKENLRDELKKECKARMMSYNDLILEMLLFYKYHMNYERKKDTL